MFPAALDDVAAAYEALSRARGPLVLAGDSAGGGLALALDAAAARSAALPLPARCGAVLALDRSRRERRLGARQ